MIYLWTSSVVNVRGKRRQFIWVRQSTEHYWVVDYRKDVIETVMLEKIEWLYRWDYQKYNATLLQGLCRLGLINYIKIGGTPSLVCLICIGIAAYLYMGCITIIIKDEVIGSPDLSLSRKSNFHVYYNWANNEERDNLTQKGRTDTHLLSKSF